MHWMPLPKCTPARASSSQTTISCARVPPPPPYSSGPPGKSAMNQSAKGGPRWLKRFVLVCTVIVAAMALLKVVTSLSDLNKQQKFNASHYNSLKSRSSTDAEALCTASLALRDGTTVESDYRIFK